MVSNIYKCVNVKCKFFLHFIYSRIDGAYYWSGGEIEVVFKSADKNRQKHI